QRDVGERLALVREAALADPGARDDPLVGGVDPLRELVVRDHPVGRMGAEPRDRDVETRLRRADHPAPAPAKPVPPLLGGSVEPTPLATNTVSIASAASSPPTDAQPCPFAIGPRTRTNSHSSVSTSPGSTTRLKRQSSMPAKNGILPAWSACASTATAPAWAIASIVSKPAITGRSGKWPANHQSSARISRRPTTRLPGSSSRISST